MFMRRPPVSDHSVRCAFGRSVARFVLFLVLLAFVPLGLTACSSIDQAQCTSNAECPGGACQAGRCVARDADASEDPGLEGDTFPGDDAGPDTGDAVILPPSFRNACGGTGPLRDVGVDVRPGDACGDFGEGVLVCASLTQLRCEGESGVNACGGRGALQVTLNTACGVCGDGRWACDDEGGVQCLGATPSNACGGCGALPSRPGAPCATRGSVDGDADGIWVCDDGNLRCDDEAENACGGAAVLLTAAGAAAQPGDACDADCGPGLLVCDGEDGLACALDPRSPPRNACGGCGPLPGAQNAACGICGGGAWTCTPRGTMVCSGTPAPDACGGCSGLRVLPGDPCSQGDPQRAGFEFLCEGEDMVCQLPVDASLQNACGGSASLEQEPGDSCGPCDDGIRVCVSPNRTECRNATEPNACGGCGPLGGRVGDRCGPCGAGTARCSGTSLACDTAGDDGRNACQGCGALDAAPGTSCGTCLVWACADSARGGTICVASRDEQGCGDLETCDTLACDAQLRTCRESDGVRPATCGSCLPGATDVDGTCQQEAPVVVTCDELGPTCAQSFRTCSQPASGDATCGGCIETARDEGGTCVPARTCSAASCASLNRVCVQSRPDVDATCGACLSGFVETNGVCTSTLPPPTGVSASDGSSADHVTVRWNASPGATGYHVYRGGVRVTSTPVTGLSWDDTGAPAGPVPDAPTSVTATTNDRDVVRVSWVAPPARAGATTRYEVRAVNAALQSSLSEPDTGFRAAEPVLRLEVQVDGTGAWNPATSSPWTYSAAEPAFFLLGTPVASTNRADAISLTIPAATPSTFTHTFRVRAVNRSGVGASSPGVQGRRDVGAVSWQWEWAEASTGPWSGLVGGTTREALDATMAPGESRWYRVRVSAPGATTATSIAVQGSRVSPGAGALGVPCTSNLQCPSNAWCPTDTTERRCSPYPTVGGAAFPFQYIPGGTFSIGALPPDSLGGVAEPVLEVTLTRDFYIQRTETTQGQWVALSGGILNPSRFRQATGTGTEPINNNPDGPVENVSWWSALAFANALSVAQNLPRCYAIPTSGCTGLWESGSLSCGGALVIPLAPELDGDIYRCTGYRLATEAEWERAARGGTTTSTYNGMITSTLCDDVNPILDPIAWFGCNNSTLRHRQVALKQPNAWGLFDVLGNVQEWVWDRMVTDANERVRGTDPAQSAGGNAAVVRSGAWNVSAIAHRVSARSGQLLGSQSQTVGFRLARSGPAR